MVKVLILVALVAVALGADYNATYNASPIWKVFCPNYIYHGRVDSLVNPGNYSGHIHKVFGGNHFSASKQERSFMQVYGITRRSTCTSCSLREVDNSNYWTSDLYYQWPNGSLSLVPNSGLTVYYLSRGGSTGANRTNPNWQPIPRGLRMLAGNTLRRFPDNSSDSKAVSYACLTDYKVQAPREQQSFPTKDNFCKNGLRAQVWFPMCWNGKDLDSADHKSHMHYPISYDNNPQGGDCPNSHPVRIPGLFVEHIYSVDQFPHGDGTRQPFVWSNGDQNGNGFHADFVSAWVPEIMAAAIAHPNCSNDNPLMAFGNRVDQCPPLAPFVKNNYGSDVDCQLSHLMPTTENLGVSNPISKLPGCNIVESGPNPQVKCAANLDQSDNSGVWFMKSKALGQYLTVNWADGFLYTNYTGPATLKELWAYNWRRNGIMGAPNGFTVIQNQDQTGYISAQSSAQSRTNDPSDWELWRPEQHGNYWAFFSNRANTGYLSTNTSNNRVGYSLTVGDSELFELVANNGGYVDLNDGLDSIAAEWANGVPDGEIQKGIDAVTSNGNGLTWHNDTATWVYTPPPTPSTQQVLQGNSVGSAAATAVSLLVLIAAAML